MKVLKNIQFWEYSLHPRFCLKHKAQIFGSSLPKINRLVKIKNRGNKISMMLRGSISHFMSHKTNSCYITFYNLCWRNPFNHVYLIPSIYITKWSEIPQDQIQLSRFIHSRDFHIFSTSFSWNISSVFNSPCQIYFTVSHTFRLKVSSECSFRFMPEFKDTFLPIKGVLFN